MGLTLPIQLYVDELEIASPLGTSHEIQKLFAVYWVLANISPDQHYTLNK